MQFAVIATVHVLFVCDGEIAALCILFGFTQCAQGSQLCHELCTLLQKVHQLALPQLAEIFVLHHSFQWPASSGVLAIEPRR